MLSVMFSHPIKAIIPIHSASIVPTKMSAVRISGPPSLWQYEREENSAVSALWGLIQLKKRPGLRSSLFPGAGNLVNNLLSSSNIEPTVKNISTNSHHFPTANSYPFSYSEHSKYSSHPGCFSSCCLCRLLSSKGMFLLFYYVV